VQSAEPPVCNGKAANIRFDDPVLIQRLDAGKIECAAIGLAAVLGEAMQA
jgi:hypothetical protein